MIRTKQTEYIKDKAKAIIVAEVFKKALEATVVLKVITVSEEVKTVIDITCYLHTRRSVIFVISQVTDQ
jgi:hypothetical protein